MDAAEQTQEGVEDVNVFDAEVSIEDEWQEEPEPSGAGQMRDPYAAFEDPEILKMSDLPDYDWVLEEGVGGVKIPDGIEKFACIIARVQAWHGDFSREDIRIASLPDMVEQASVDLEIWLVVTGRVKDRNALKVAEMVRSLRNRYPRARLHAKPKIATAAIIEAMYERNNEVVNGAIEDVSEEQQEFDKLGRYAFDNGVSDIHIEVTSEQAQILMRQHGRLRHYKDLAPAKATAICSAVYNTMSEAGSTRDSFNERKFQNAVIDRPYDEGRVRFRYASMPVAPNGFNVVLRLLPVGVESAHKSFEDLGYAPAHTQSMQRAMARSSGMVIIAGTTGSGKSTTLKNAMEGVATANPDQKIRTIEEPVEYSIRNTSQTPVVRDDKEKDGANSSKPFADAIKAAMRADPDRMLVGEIRDKITAELAIQASQTGHGVATTLHAESWSGIFDRLGLLGIQMGVLAQPGLIAGLAYQKLMPVLCEHCKISFHQWVDEQADMENPKDSGFVDRVRRVVPDADLVMVYMTGPGCRQCKGTGITGQTVCAEVVLPTNAMLDAVRHGDVVKLRQLWREQRNDSDPDDMSGRTAFEHALLKMRHGICDPKDVESKFMRLDEVFHLDD
ncbi:GspE/PulE family protein [Thioalkalivibrio sp. K90mix]|uniref:GspE/PulE family protein n=1 Tax=Thioalkalivibrio sp. (strain K90mix) TaxID=396595 RepID=UPI000374AE43|nr:ATPase, T2SS/T4P/T4SS family [Thioalkalivibrio sp. K90mix]